MERSEERGERREERRAKSEERGERDEEQKRGRGGPRTGCCLALFASAFHLWFPPPGLEPDPDMQRDGDAQTNRGW
jgi:hypothetical protein